MSDPPINQIVIGNQNAVSGTGDATVNVTNIIYQHSLPQPIDPATLTAAERLFDTLPIDHLPSHATLPTGSRIPFARNPLFVGREQDLLNLANYLKAGETAAIGQIAAATGLGGIGKTQLAAEFAHHYGQYFSGGVFWLSFAEAQNIASEVAACGSQAYLKLRPDFEQLDLQTQVQLVLSAWQSPLPRLLVFDNCEDEVLLQWRPPTGGCRILITSRRARWSRSLGVHPLSLNVLARDESVALLLKHRPDLAADDPDLNAIAEELGDLPLALHLAGSYLETFKDSPRFGSPATFLAELRDARILNHLALQGEDVTPSSTNHSLHVGRTFALSYDRLKPDQSIDAMALKLLSRAAHLAPGELIPRELLLATLNLAEDDRGAAKQSEHALNRLIELGLLTAAAQETVTLHRLLVYFVRQTAVDATDAQAAVEGAILQALSERQDQAGHLASMVLLQAHLRFVTDAALDREDQQAAELSGWLGYYLRQIGDYEAARPYFDRALAIREKVLGPEHPSTAESLNNLAVLLQAQGDYQVAHLYFDRALAIREKVLGPEHPNTALSLNNLAMLLQAQGDYEAARPYFDRALTIKEKVLGPEHPSTANSLNNLASLLQDQGDYEAAQPLYERALAIREKVLGPEHPSTAESLNNLASLLQDQGDYQVARPYFDRALAIREKVLGPEHPSTAISLNNLAVLLKDQGDYEAARPLYERALVIIEKVLGSEHPSTAISLNNLASLLKAQGNYEAARPLYERALTICEKVLGPEHPHTQLVRANLASLDEKLRAPK